MEYLDNYSSPPGEGEFHVVTLDGLQALKGQVREAMRTGGRDRERLRRLLAAVEEAIRRKARGELVMAAEDEDGLYLAV